MRSLLLVGEGSLEDGRAAQQVYDYAAMAQELTSFQQVGVGFLLQEPSLRQLLRLSTSTDVTIVPVTPLADPLTLEVIPRELGLGHQGSVPPGGVARTIGGKTVRYLPALEFFVGKPLAGATLDQLRQGFLHLGQLLAGPEFSDGDVSFEYQLAWTTLKRQAVYGLRVGEVLIERHGLLYELRHALDEGRDRVALSTLVTLEGLRGATSRTDDGHFRPIRTLRTLPRGWRAIVNDSDLPAALTALYPGITEEAFAYRQHTLHWTPWPTTARRYGRPTLLQATAQHLEETAQALCRRCLRTRLWAGETLSQTFLSGAPGELPCPEACSLFAASLEQRMAEATQ